MSKNITKRFGLEQFKPSNFGALGCHGRDVQSWVRSILRDDPARLAAVLTDMRRPPSVSSARYGLAIRSGRGREPLLNADKMAIERSLSKHFDEHGSKHAKDKVIKTVIVKPNSGPAAKIAGTWASHSWKVWSLKYGPGLVLQNHNGEESDVFAGWGKLKSTLESIGFKIVR